MNTPKARKYFTLAVREDGRWGPDFGDYDVMVVRQELMNRRDSGTKGKDLFIVSTGETQAEIDVAIAKLNARHQG